MFSSLVAEDIKFEGLSKPGVVALKEFLKLARDGYSDFNSPTGRSFDSDFEEAVSYAVRELGYECHPQVGMAGFFIDLAVIDPNDPDRYILGVECDGAAYHSSRYARDRDRLRQQILESRGWKIHRIWSTDWFYRQAREVQKLRKAIEDAVAGRSLPNADHIYEPGTDHDGIGGFEEAPRNGGDDFAPHAHQVVAHAPPESASRLPPYLFSQARGAGGASPHEMSDDQLAYLVEQIVSIEQPIHEEEVARRVAAACGLQRAGSRIQEAAGRGLRASMRQGQLRADGPFWMLADAKEVQARNRSGLAASEPVRKPAMISPLEISSAAHLVLRQNLAMDLEELVVETARLLGFARTGSDVAIAIETAIDKHLRPALSSDHLGRLKFST